MWNLYGTFRAGPLPISSKPMLRKASRPCEIPQSDQIDFFAFIYTVIYIYMCVKKNMICMYACVFVFVFVYFFKMYRMINCKICDNSI